ncbi:hypothetical protein NMY22_g15656 [Coprinellus aureogranulatus]|nr:hypothetical protein NMY22_g15656 [Coprinellus aureogranulatus]
MPQIAAEWTTEADQPAKPCDRCQILVPFDIWKKNVNINQRNPNVPPRHHCEACFQYYLKKPTTRAVTNSDANGRGLSVQTHNEHRSTTPAHRSAAAHPSLQQAAALPPLLNAAAHPQVPLYGPVDVEAVYRNNLAAQRPDLGHGRVPVQALPPSITASKHYQPGLPYNPYAHLAGLGAGHPVQAGAWTAGGQPGFPAGVFSPQVASSVPQYGYGPQHQLYAQEKRQKYARLQKEGQSHVFQATVQVVYELENAEIKGKKFKRYEPLDNLADTISVTPYTTAGDIVAASREKAVELVKAREADFHYFDFNFQSATVRDPISWADLDKHVGNGEGFFQQLVMLPAAAKGRAAANFNAKPPLQFKAPKEPPVIVVVVPWKKYSAYLHFAEEVELMNASPVTGPKSNYSRDADTFTSDSHAIEPESKKRRLTEASAEPKKTHRSHLSDGGCMLLLAHIALASTDE